MGFHRCGQVCSWTLSLSASNVTFSAANRDGQTAATTTAKLTPTAQDKVTAALGALQGIDVAEWLLGPRSMAEAFSTDAPVYVVSFKVGDRYVSGSIPPTPASDQPGRALPQGLTDIDEFIWTLYSDLVTCDETSELITLTGDCQAAPNETHDSA